MMFYEIFEVCRGGVVYYGFVLDFWLKDFSLSLGLDCELVFIISVMIWVLFSLWVSLSFGVK